MKTIFKVTAGVLGVYLLIKMFGKSSPKIMAIEEKIGINQTDQNKIKKLDGKLYFERGTVIDYGIVTNSGVIIKSISMPEIDNIFVPMKYVKILSVVSRENELPAETKIEESKLKLYYNNGILNPSVDKNKVVDKDGVIYIKNDSYISNGFEVRKGAYVIFELTQPYQISADKSEQTNDAFGYSNIEKVTEFLPDKRLYSNPQAFINDNFYRYM